MRKSWAKEKALIFVAMDIFPGKCTQSIYIKRIIWVLAHLYIFFIDERSHCRCFIFVLILGSVPHLRPLQLPDEQRSPSAMQAEHQRIHPQLHDLRPHHDAQGDPQLQRHQAQQDLREAKEHLQAHGTRATRGRP